MNIAYIFHGHSRTWKDCYQSFFDNVYSVAPGDIYIHTWDRVNSMYGSFWNKWFSRLEGEAEEMSAKTLDLDSIRKIYKPKRIIVETDIGIELVHRELPQITSINSTVSHLGAYNMVKSQWIAFNMAKSTHRYDRYFSCRPDLMFPNKLDFAELQQEEFMMVPPTFADYNDPRTEMIFDIFAFGTEQIMELRANFYKNIWNYWYSTNNVTGGYFLEHAATKYFRDNGIQARPSSLNFEIKRLF
jgi:hypothetical protein